MVATIICSISKSAQGDNIITANQFCVPGDGDSTIADIRVKSINNLYGDYPIAHLQMSSKESNDDVISMIIIMRHGVNNVTSIQNSNILIRDVRDKFCYCDSIYQVSNLISVKRYMPGDKCISLEYISKEISAQQLQSLFNNM